MEVENRRNSQTNNDTLDFYTRLGEIFKFSPTAIVENSQVPTPAMSHTEEERALVVAAMPDAIERIRQIVAKEENERGNGKN